MGLYTLFFKQQREYQIIDLVTLVVFTTMCFFKTLLSEIERQHSVMLILTPPPTSCLDDGLQPRAVTRPRQHSHGYAISLIQLISKSTIYYPSSPCNQLPPSISFSQAMMRYGETERD